MATPRMFTPALDVAALTHVATAPDGTPPPPAPPKNNAIYLSDGQYDDSMSQDDVVSAFKAFDASGQTRLALFFHGGLVDKDSAAQGAGAQWQLYNNVCYPYFFIWESGIWEILAHHLPEIFASTLFTALHSHLTDTTAPAAGVPQTSTALDFLSTPQSVANHPLNTSMSSPGFTISQAAITACVSAVAGDTRVQNALAGVARFNLSLTPDMHAKIAQTRSIELGPNEHLNDALVGLVTGAYKGNAKPSAAPQEATALFGFDIGGAVAAAWAFATQIVPTILNNVANRFAHGRDHGIFCTVVEEILRVAYITTFGTDIWEEMKTETAEAFGADATKFGGTAVVKEIVARIVDKKNIQVTLVGHSAGAVYVGNFLDAVDAALTAAGDSTFTFDVVLMAAADTFTFQVANYAKRIRGVRSFGMTDLAESQDLLMSNDTATSSNPDLLGRIYPRSLLYLISGALETDATGIPTTPPHDLDTSDMPITGMDRFYANQAIFTPPSYPDVQAERAGLANTGGSNLFMRVLSPSGDTAPPGQQCDAVKHGGFPADPLMVGSLTYLLQGGVR
jgi:hypothetical protein